MMTHGNARAAALAFARSKVGDALDCELTREVVQDAIAVAWMAGRDAERDDRRREEVVADIARICSDLPPDEIKHLVRYALFLKVESRRDAAGIDKTGG